MESFTKYDQMFPSFLQIPLDTKKIGMYIGGVDIIPIYQLCSAGSTLTKSTTS